MGSTTSKFLLLTEKPNTKKYASLATGPIRPRSWSTTAENPGWSTAGSCIQRSLQTGAAARNGRLSSSQAPQRSGALFSRPAHKRHASYTASAGTGAGTPCPGPAASGFPGCGLPVPAGPPKPRDPTRHRARPQN